MRRLRELGEDGVVDAVDLPAALAAGTPPNPEPGRQLVAHLGGGQRGGGVGVAVEAAGVERPAGPVGEGDGVGDDVVVVGERVQRPRGEMPERRHRPPGRRDGLPADPSRRGVLFEPTHRPVVAVLDRAEHRRGDLRATEEGEDAEGLLGGEGEVVARPARRGVGGARGTRPARRG